MEILVLMTRPQSVTTCLPKCLQPSFELDIRYEPVTNWERTLDGYTTIYLFRKTEVDTQEEYLLYDFNAIVAAVGGSLGLFLGMSCLSALLPWVDRLADKICTCIKKQHQ